jgi:hypothetical protein
MLKKPKDVVLQPVRINTEMTCEQVINVIQVDPTRNATLMPLVNSGHTEFLIYTSDYEILHVRWVLQYRAKPRDIGIFEIVGQNQQLKENLKFKWLAE